MPPLPKRTSRDLPDGKPSEAPLTSVAPPPPHPPTGNGAIPVPPPPPPPPGTGVQKTWRQQQQETPRPAPASAGRADPLANRALPPRPIMDDQSDFTRMGMQMAARRGRRQTEPAVFAAPPGSSPGTSPGPTHGLNSEFKKMLEAKLRGDVAGPPGGPPAGPPPHRHGAPKQPEEGDYAAIEPDDVTFLNEKYNS